MNRSLPAFDPIAASFLGRLIFRFDSLDEASSELLLESTKLSQERCCWWLGDRRAVGERKLTLKKPSALGVFSSRFFVLV